ncbi:MAG TPA: hypothetical protein VF223_08375 [Trebonia sp.]
MPNVNADEPGRATITLIQMGLGAQGPQHRAKYLSDAQMQLGWALRAAVKECQEAGLSWQAIGNALGVPKETLFRQFSAGGPVITAKPIQSMASPGVTTMHRSGAEAVYAFRSQDGNWFGPHTELPDGEFTDGTLHFEPAQPANPFAGQDLTMRFGFQEGDVSVHACRVTLPDGVQRRVRVTHAVLDLMFGDGQAPLRRAMTAVTHAAMGNPQLPAQLQAMIDQAARAMGPGVPIERLTAAVGRVVALVGFDVADENVAAAIRRLEQAAVEYRIWVTVTSGRRSDEPASTGLP